MTWAPKSAMAAHTDGAKTIEANSTTRTPTNGSQSVVRQNRQPARVVPPCFQISQMTGKSYGTCGPTVRSVKCNAIGRWRLRQCDGFVGYHPTIVEVSGHVLFLPRLRMSIFCCNQRHVGTLRVEMRCDLSMTSKVPDRILGQSHNSSCYCVT